MKRIEEFKFLAEELFGLDVYIKGRKDIPLDTDIVIHLEDTEIFINSENPVINYYEYEDFFLILRRRSKQFLGRDEHVFLSLLNRCLEKDVQLIYSESK